MILFTSTYISGEAANQLSKYLLKTLCSDLTSIIVKYVAEDLGVVSDMQEDVSLKVDVLYVRTLINIDAILIILLGKK